MHTFRINHLALLLLYILLLSTLPGHPSSSLYKLIGNKKRTQSSPRGQEEDTVFASMASTRGRHKRTKRTKEGKGSPAQPAAGGHQEEDDWRTRRGQQEDNTYTQGSGAARDRLFEQKGFLVQRCLAWCCLHSKKRFTSFANETVLLGCGSHSATTGT